MTKPSLYLMGSKPGAAVALSIFLERGWDVRAVVVSPKFDHDWIPKPSLEDVARAAGVTVVTKQSALVPLGPADFVISYMFRYLVKAPTRDLARRAALNFHAGPLPEFGGWAFYSQAILENSPEYGCTCHYMDDGFDTGPLLKVRRFPIDARQETAFTLERKAQEEMLRLLHDFCDLAETGDPLPRQEQDRARMRYMSRDEFDALKRIPPGADEETIDRHARAFWFPPYDLAYVEVDGKRIEVVPRIARQSLASLLHAADHEHLAKVGRSR